MRPDQVTTTPPAASNTLVGQLLRWLLIQITGVGSNPTSMRLGTKIKAKTDLLALDIELQLEATVHPLDAN